MQTRLGVFALAIGAVASAHAASPDPRGHTPMEDALADGEIDAEDFVSWRMGRPFSPVGSRAGAYVAVSAFTTYGSGEQEKGAMLVVQLPFDRLFGPAPPPRSVPIAEPTAPPVPAPAPAPAPAVAAVAVTVSPADARACVRAALRAAGMGDDARLASIVSRARASAALPELRLRGLKNVDQSGRLTYTELDPYRYSETGATGYTLEARLTFRLDRLLFADEEVSIERLQVDRQEARTRIAAKVLAALFEWQRAHSLEKSPTLTTDEHVAAVLREAEAAAMLDVMTDGWFSKWRAPAEGAAETK